MEGVIVLQTPIYISEDTEEWQELRCGLWRNSGETEVSCQPKSDCREPLKSQQEKFPAYKIKIVGHSYPFLLQQVVAHLTKKD